MWALLFFSPPTGNVKTVFEQTKIVRVTVNVHTHTHHPLTLFDFFFFLLQRSSPFSQLLFSVTFFVEKKKEISIFWDPSFFFFKAFSPPPLPLVLLVLNFLTGFVVEMN